MQAARRKVNKENERHMWIIFIRTLFILLRSIYA